jgi:hypothetical protein
MFKHVYSQMEVLFKTKGRFCMIMKHEVHPELLTVFSALPGSYLSSIESRRKMTEQMHTPATIHSAFKEFYSRTSG